MKTTKNHTKPNIVFMGSGPVAAESLRQIQAFFTIEAVVTKPTTKNQMKAVCESVPIYTVSSRSELDELFTTENFTSLVGIIIDFGIIVSQQSIEYFKKGIVNSHFSLLPELRGADPISFAILEGKAQTGVSLMMLVEAMDEGPLLHQASYKLLPNETTSSLTKELIELSTSLLAEYVPVWLDGTIKAVPQNDAIPATYTRKLTKQDGVLDYTKSATQLEREIRAYDEWPKSRTSIGDVDCVILSATVTNDTGTPGTITVEKKQLLLHTTDGSLNVQRIKPAGKAAMDIAGFLNGYRSKIT